MEINKTYNPLEIENKWLKIWFDNNLFKSEPNDKEPYTIVMPPPNITGILHIGHVLNNTIQDVLIRRARMLNKNACWIPGIDHASIATEVKVNKMLEDKNIDKSTLSKEEFLNYCWQWKEKYGGIILEQLKKIGLSCDFSQTKFTMDPDMSEAVSDIFIRLYNKGLIYRSSRIINWDPISKTALSDEEVIHKETAQKLYYIKYELTDSKEHVVIATTRPETIMADVALAINPTDDRYLHLKNKTVKIPLINKEIPIIFDENVDKDFGTGCLKITPGNAYIDYKIAKKHNLQAVEILTDDAKLNANAQILIGLDRFDARKQIETLLQDNGSILKIEDHISQIGFSERTNAIIEPKISIQWFCKMVDLAKPAINAVKDGTINLIPQKFNSTYFHWLNNIQDWCISRQLSWGHPIPVFYLKNTDKHVAAKTITEAITLFKTKHNINVQEDDIYKDPDVLDTWFSSWLWPITVFDPEAIKKSPEDFNEKLKYYYPTNDLVTAPEILFFWVARMVISGYEITGKAPFKNVYLTGIVRDSKRIKMSKSLGNSPDVLKLIDKYGADALRCGILLSSPAGNDLLFDETHCEQGRNFVQKIWSAYRFLKKLEPNDKEPLPINKTVNAYMSAKIDKTINATNHLFEQYKISDALMHCYKLFWEDFCNFYLECIKPEKNEHIDRTTLNIAVGFFNKLLGMLHPFIPFITDELWHNTVSKEANYLSVTQLPATNKNYDRTIITDIEKIMLLSTWIRNTKVKHKLKNSDLPNLYIESQSETDYTKYKEIIEKYSKVKLTINSSYPNSSLTYIIDTDKFILNISAHINTSDIINQLEKDLQYQSSFLKSVEAKLNNAKFIANAKEEVIEKERKKELDTKKRIDAIKLEINKLIN
ncbi:MAG: valine--tRNA ligase [Solitalea-like symbiont of Tyrophagus putrescentiae]